MLKKVFFQKNLFTFALMKKKNILFSLYFAMMVLSAIVLQGVHSFHHLEQFLAEKHCDHHYNDNNPEISHAHSDLDDCFVCEFAFSSTYIKEFLSISFHKNQLPDRFYFFKPHEIIDSFRGSLYSLRGPPCF